MSLEKINNSDKYEPKVDLPSIESNTGIGRCLPNDITKMDNLEEDKQLALEYIQNDLGFMYVNSMDSTSTLKPNYYVVEKISADVILEPENRGSTSKQNLNENEEIPGFLTNAENMESTSNENPELNAVEKNSDIAAGTPIDPAATVIHICDYCNKLFTTESEYETHECPDRPNFNGFILKETVLPDTVMIETNPVDNTTDLVIERVVTGDLIKKPQVIVKKELRTKRKVFKLAKPSQATNLRNNRDKGTHYCNICNKTLSRRSSLTVHMRRHTGDMPYDCDHCQKKFPTVYDLDRHMLTHMAKRKYSFCCNICLKPFVTESGMAQHKTLNHKILTMHSCEVCGLIFSRKTKLTKHLEVHTAEDRAVELLDPSNTVIVVYGNDNPIKSVV